jgi:hypothetical protein
MISGQPERISLIHQQDEEKSETAIYDKIDDF